MAVAAKWWVCGRVDPPPPHISPQIHTPRHVQAWGSLRTGPKLARVTPMRSVRFGGASSFSFLHGGPSGRGPRAGSPICRPVRHRAAISPPHAQPASPQLRIGAGLEVPCLELGRVVVWLRVWWVLCACCEYFACWPHHTQGRSAAPHAPYAPSFGLACALGGLRAHYGRA